MAWRGLIGFFRRRRPRRKPVALAPVPVAPEVVEVVAPAPVVEADPLDFLKFARQTTPPEAVDDASLEDVVREIALIARKIMVDSPSAIPAMATQVMDAVDQLDVDAARLADLIAHDPMLAAQVLRVANSSFHSPGRRIADLREAVARLGLTEVSRIAAVASATALSSSVARQAFTDFPELAQELWAHSIGTAAASAWLAERLTHMKMPSAFLSGLMHDVGKIVGLQAYAVAVRDRRVRRLNPAELDRMLELAHVNIGGEMAELCRFPPGVQMVCWDHHIEWRPGAAPQFGLAVVVVSSFLDELIGGQSPDPAHLHSAMLAAHGLKLDQPRLRALAAEIEASRARAPEVYGAPI